MNDWNKHNYLSLATKKRDGSFVETPVWFAKEGNTIYCFSEGNKGKVKRLRNFSEVRINPCTVTGKLLGDWDDVQGFLVTGADAQESYQALLNKYGLQMRLLDVMSWIGRKKHKRAFIKIIL